MTLIWQIKNILRAQGNVEFEDKLENNKIFTDELTYFKKQRKLLQKVNLISLSTINMKLIRGYKLF